MPINLQWKPSNKPPTTDNPENLGVEIGGDDASLPIASPGRIRLVEVADPSKSGGAVEAQQERLIATFHGNFHRDGSVADVRTRITFQILTNPAVRGSPHDQEVPGFDPECMFGVDAVIFTMVNRRFVCWLPFYVDSRSEGNFLDLVVVAEVPGTGTTFRELGRSAVLNLGIRRKHRVRTTSLSNNIPLTYTGNLVGNVVCAQEEFIVEAQVRDPQRSTQQQIVLQPTFIPVPTGGGGDIRFAAYRADAMFVMLSTTLLGALRPSAAQLQSRVTNLPNPNAAQGNARTTIRDHVTATAQAIFRDAGFTGARVLWQDDPAAAAFDQTYRASFVDRGNRWDLGNPARPFVTPFWNFVVAHDSTIQGAVATGEHRQLDTATQRNVAGTRAFINYALPIGQGNKNMTDPIRLNGDLMLDHTLNFSGTARRFKDEAELTTALERYADHIGIIVAHEVGHALGLMHTPHVESGDFSEANGSPVLTIMSEGVDSGGFGTNMRFSSQAKVMFAGVFGVTPTFPDATLANKTWTAAEVRSIDWPVRKKRFFDLHGESGMRIPPFASLNAGVVPPFAIAPPGAQRGTFK